MIERGGRVVIRMLENVQQKTIAPLIEKFIAPGTQVYTDEYDIYARLPQWGYDHKTVCHSRGEYARDDDGEAFTRRMSTRWRAFGRYCPLGCVPIVGFPKRSCLCTWPSLSSCITPGVAVKGCWSPCSAPY